MNTLWVHVHVCAQAHAYSHTHSSHIQHMYIGDAKQQPYQVRFKQHIHNSTSSHTLSHAPSYTLSHTPSPTQSHAQATPPIKLTPVSRSEAADLLVVGEGGAVTVAVQEEPGVEVLQPQGGATLHRLAAWQRKDPGRFQGGRNQRVYHFHPLSYIMADLHYSKNSN